MMIFSLVISFCVSAFALELEHPHGTIVIDQRTDYANTNFEVTTGVGVHIWEYEKDQPERGDNVELKIVGTANSRKIVNYRCENDIYDWHDSLMWESRLYLDDNQVVKVNLQHLARFYGGRGPLSHNGEPGSADYKSIWICSNGWISFSDPQKPQPAADTKILIPYEGQANSVVAPFSRDLKPNLGGVIRYGYIYHESSHFGVDPYCFCLTWENVPDETGNPQTFQMLIEQQNSAIRTLPRQSFIWFQYKQITKDKLTTVGIEDHLGGNCTTYNYQNLENGKTLCFRGNEEAAEINSITIRLIENEATASTDIIMNEDCIRGYNIILKKTVKTPDQNLRFAKAVSGVPTMCITAYCLFMGNPNTSYSISCRYSNRNHSFST